MQMKSMEGSITSSSLRVCMKSENIKAMSLYDTGVLAHFGDEFITLSCCSYHVEDGRSVVVFVRGKDREPDTPSKRSVLLWVEKFMTSSMTWQKY